MPSTVAVRGQSAVAAASRRLRSALPSRSRAQSAWSDAGLSPGRRGWSRRRQHAQPLKAQSVGSAWRGLFHKASGKGTGTYASVSKCAFRPAGQRPRDDGHCGRGLSGAAFEKLTQVEIAREASDRSNRAVQHHVAAFVPDLDGHAMSPAFTAPPWFDSRPAERLRGRRIGEVTVSPALPVPFPCTNHRCALEIPLRAARIQRAALAILWAAALPMPAVSWPVPAFCRAIRQPRGPWHVVRCSCRLSVPPRLRDDHDRRRSAGAAPALSALRGFGASRCVQCGSAPLVSGKDAGSLPAFRPSAGNGSTRPGSTAGTL